MFNRFFWCFILLSLQCSLVFAQETQKAFIRLLDNISTFEAHFVQKVQDADGLSLAQSEGKLVIARPNKFYWSSQAPETVLIVADGKFLWTYDVDLAQVTKQDLRSAINNTPATLLAGTAQSWENYFKVTAAPARQCRHLTQCFLLQPTRQDAPFSEIFMGFSGEKLVEIRMRDALGQRVHTVFNKIVMNHKVRDKLFIFVPPKGVDVIQHQASE